MVKCKSTLDWSGCPLNNHIIEYSGKKMHNEFHFDIHSIFYYVFRLLF